MNFYLKLIIIGILCQINCRSANGASRNAISHMTPFHPITQEQYDAILGLTSGEPVISEARLIASGLAALKGLIALITTGFSASWLTSIFHGLVGNTQANNTNNILKLQDGYPLCVVRSPTEDEYNHRTFEESQIPSEHNHNQPPATVIKCILVVKNEDEEHQQPTYPPHTTQSPQQHYAPDTRTYPPAGYPYAYPWYNYYFPYTQYNNIPYGSNQYQSNLNYEPSSRYYPQHYPNPYEAPSARPSRRKHSHRHKSSSGYKSKKHKSSHSKNRKPHPVPAPFVYYDYIAPQTPTVRRRKTKRDQNSKIPQQQIVDNPNNYAKPPNYPAGGYQPSTYPQFSYHSQYPKVAYTSSYNYPSPIYVGTTPRSEQRSWSLNEEHA